MKRQLKNDLIFYLGFVLFGIGAYSLYQASLTLNYSWIIPNAIGMFGGMYAILDATLDATTS